MKRIILICLFCASPVFAALDFGKAFYKRFASNNYFVIGSNDLDLKPSSRFFVLGDFEIGNNLRTKTIQARDNATNFIQLNSNNISFVLDGQEKLFLDLNDTKITNSKISLGDNFKINQDRLSIGTEASDESLNIGGAIAIEESDSLPNISKGYGKIYAKTDGKIYYLNSQGEEYDLTDIESGKSKWENLGGYLHPKLNQSILIGSKALADSSFAIDPRDGSALINSAAKDIVFRVYGESEDNLFVVNSEKISIAKDSASSKLDINGDLRAAYLIGDGSKLTNLPAQELSGPINDAVNAVNLIGEGIVVNTDISTSSASNLGIDNSNIQTSQISNSDISESQFFDTLFQGNNYFDSQSNTILQSSFRIPDKAQSNYALTSSASGFATWQILDISKPRPAFDPWILNPNKFLYPGDISGFILGSTSPGHGLLKVSQAGGFRLGEYSNLGNIPVELKLYGQNNKEFLTIDTHGLNINQPGSNQGLGVKGDIFVSGFIYGDGYYLKNISGANVIGAVREALNSKSSEHALFAENVLTSLDSDIAKAMTKGTIINPHIMGGTISGAKFINLPVDVFEFSQMAASDGSPNPALVVDDKGYIGIANLKPKAQLEIGNASPEFVDGVNDLLVSGNVSVYGTTYARKVEAKKSFIGKTTTGIFCVNLDSKPSDDSFSEDYIRCKEAHSRTSTMSDEANHMDNGVIIASVFEGGTILDSDLEAIDNTLNHENINGVDYENIKISKLVSPDSKIDPVLMVNQDGYLGLGTTNPKALLDIGSGPVDKISSPNSSLAVLNSIQAGSTITGPKFQARYIIFGCYQLPDTSGKMIDICSVDDLLKAVGR